MRFDMLVDKMIIDLNVFGTFMEDIIMGNIDSRNRKGRGA